MWWGCIVYGYVRVIYQTNSLSIPKLTGRFDAELSKHLLTSMQCCWRDPCQWSSFNFQLRTLPSSCFWFLSTSSFSTVLRHPLHLLHNVVQCEFSLWFWKVRKQVFYLFVNLFIMMLRGWWLRAFVSYVISFSCMFSMYAVLSELGISWKEYNIFALNLNVKIYLSIIVYVHAGRASD